MAFPANVQQGVWLNNHPSAGRGMTSEIHHCRRTLLQDHVFYLWTRCWCFSSNGTPRTEMSVKSLHSSDFLIFLPIFVPRWNTSISITAQIKAHVNGCAVVWTIVLPLLLQGPKLRFVKPKKRLCKSNYRSRCLKVWFLNRPLAWNEQFRLFDIMRCFPASAAHAPLMVTIWHYKAPLKKKC